MFRGTNIENIVLHQLEKIGTGLESNTKEIARLGEKMDSHSRDMSRLEGRVGDLEENVGYLKRAEVSRIGGRKYIVGIITFIATLVGLAIALTQLGILNLPGS